MVLRKGVEPTLEISETSNIPSNNSHTSCKDKQLEADVNKIDSKVSTNIPEDIEHQKRAPGVHADLSLELNEILAAWPHLSEHIRVEILWLAKSSRAQKEDSPAPSNPN